MIRAQYWWPIIIGQWPSFQEMKASLPVFVFRSAGLSLAILELFWTCSSKKLAQMHFIVLHVNQDRLIHILYQTYRMNAYFALTFLWGSLGVLNYELSAIKKFWRVKWQMTTCKFQTDKHQLETPIYFMTEKRFNQTTTKLTINK